jgi:NAD(P)-dependent dehydrogenase (short-subunit alcohol dehydrogenase family)
MGRRRGIGCVGLDWTVEQKVTMELKNKICMVAGASGTIGGSIARRFRQEGARLALTYHSSKPEQLCSELAGNPDSAVWYQLDVTDRDQVQRVVTQAQRDFSGLDVLVNCTGTVGPIGPLETLDIREWIRTIETNLFGAVNLTQAVLPAMKKLGKGKILLFSGGGAAYARPYFSSYSSAKAALVRFTETLGQELKSSNVQVNAIAPGAVNSRMWDDMRAAATSGGPTLLEELKQMQETGGASPDRAAGLAVFLASDRSDGLTGRLFSAIWDDWEHLEDHVQKIASSDMFTLRRIPFS